MSEREFYQWKLFYPFLSNDDDLQHSTFCLKTKLQMFDIDDAKHFHQTRFVERFFPLENSQIALNIRSNNQIEFQLRNRHREIVPTIEHWSKFELKTSRIDLPEKIRLRLDENLLERIQRYLHETSFDTNLPFQTIELQKSSTIWQIDETDRQIEQTDVNVIIPNNNENLQFPQHWRTICIQTSDHQQLCKTLTTFQLEDDKDFLDYLTFLLSSQTHQLNSLTTSELSSGKAFVNLFSMSDAAFIELIRTIHFHH